MTVQREEDQKRTPPHHQDQAATLTKPEASKDKPKRQPSQRSRATPFGSPPSTALEKLPPLPRRLRRRRHSSANPNRRPPRLSAHRRPRRRLHRRRRRRRRSDRISGPVEPRWRTGVSSSPPLSASDLRLSRFRASEICADGFSAAEVAARRDQFVFPMRARVSR